MARTITTPVRRSSKASTAQGIACVAHLADGRHIEMTLHPAHTVWDVLHDKHGYTGKFVVEYLGIVQL